MKIKPTSYIKFMEEYINYCNNHDIITTIQYLNRFGIKAEYKDNMIDIPEKDFTVFLLKFS